MHGVTALILLGAAAPAAAAPDGLMRVSELQLARGGDRGAQFVELHDAGGEAFLEPSYTVAVRDGGGELAGAQTFRGPGYGFAHDSRPYVLATPTAGVSDPGGRLQVRLPAMSGQVCFHRGDTADPATAIHCLGYGPVGAPVVDGLEVGPAPVDGASLQRCAGGPPRVGSPSPGEPTPSAVCSGAGSGPDRRAPTLWLAGRRSQRVTAVRLAIRVDEAASIVARASVRLTAGSRPLAFRTVRRGLAAGRSASVRLRLPSTRLRAVLKALRRGAQLAARVEVEAHDRAGNRAIARRTVRLRT